MTLPTFWRALRRSWLPALLLFLASLLGAVVYAQQTIQPTAEATVAVRDPVTVRPSYEAAQITFDAVVGSHRLAERVAKRLGQPVGTVEGALSVDVVPPASGFNVSPLYSVHAEMPDVGSALELVKVAVEESQNLYVELNQTSVETISATMQTEREAAQTREKDARAALDAFVLANDTADLPQRLDTESARVTRLQQQIDDAEADLAGTQRTSDPSLVAVISSRVDEFQTQMEASVAERDRLRGMERPYLALQDELTRASARLDQLDDLEQQSILSQLLPLDSQVKVLDEARVQSQAIMKILVYGVAIILGLLAAATVAYMRFLRDQSSETEESISLAFGAPVLARIPTRSLQEVLR